MWKYVKNCIIDLKYQNASGIQWNRCHIQTVHISYQFSQMKLYRQEYNNRTWIKEQTLQLEYNSQFTKTHRPSSDSLISPFSQISENEKANSSASGVSTPLLVSSQSEDSLKRVNLFQTEYYRLFIYLGCMNGLVYHCASDTYWTARVLRSTSVAWKAIMLQILQKVKFVQTMNKILNWVQYSETIFVRSSSYIHKIELYLRQYVYFNFVVRNNKTRYKSRNSHFCGIYDIP
ncbi:Hypothetical_protein [Hexamita inflata]|uniref:Hypothetical_protein n=1 Tax=Hexamita inflata TaxID=28002 RepID=A0AA86TH93_9EUKA|nr:Hypothetical protein HINF_LOCUS5175 [Hexamita inflata]